MSLPLSLRDRLARLVLASFHDPDARRSLERLAAARPQTTPYEDDRDLDVARLFAVERAGQSHPVDAAEGGARAACEQHAERLRERAERARHALGARPFDPGDAPLPVALDQARILFDARLYFEVHERLEPYWIRAEGVERQALQGLIQVAVALHHLGNGNTAGARSLLRDGASKLLAREVAG